MYKIFTILFGLTLLSSCTEEVSDELKNSDSSAASSTETAKFVGKSIRLVSTMGKELSFTMHKAGTIDTPCTIVAPATGFDSAKYHKDDSNLVADCILDVEEADLFLKGAKYQLEVDEFLCEYVRYKPFKFIEFPYGATTRTVYKVSCDDSLCDSRCGNTYDVYTNSGLSSGMSTVANDAKCYFNHSENDSDDPNCDQGKITTIEYKVAGTFSATPADNTCAPGGALSYVTTSDADCGGDFKACFGGPSVDQIGAEYSSEILNNEELAEFKKEWTIDPTLERTYGSSNLYSANYSRICSNTTDTKAAFGDYEIINLRGHEIETFRNTTGLTNLSVDTDADGTDEYTSLAENPFRDYHGHANMYYGFYCLDKAFDIKAQIRLYIREWDRKFTKTNPYLAKVSDAHTSGTPLMDNSGTQDSTEPWNNKWDWDDFWSAQSVFSNDSCYDTDPAKAFKKTAFPSYIFKPI